MRTIHMVLACAVLAQCAIAAEWSRLRGADGAGLAGEASLPVEFGPDTNVLWKTDVPFANSSPVLSDGTLFLTASTDDHLLILALNADTGAMEWQREIERTRTAKVHAQNDSASPTPVVSDGNVYAFFQELGVVSYTTTGEHCWTLPLDPFVEYYGMAASPVVAAGKVFLSCDQQQGSYLLAIDALDGDIAWKADRAIRGSSWTTPIVYPATGQPQTVIVHGDNWIDAYAIENGDHLWGISGFGRGPITVPFLSGNRLFTNAPQHAESDGSGFQLETFDELATAHDENNDDRLTHKELQGNLFANEFGWGDADKDGFITRAEYETIYEAFYTDDFGLTALELNPADPAAEPKPLWQYRGTLAYISSPVVYRDTVFFADKKGFINAVDPGTGDLVKRERVKGAGASFFASALAGDGKVYLPSMNGKVVVIDAKPEWSVLAVNDLEDRITASPIASDGRLYIRTKGAMYCFAGP